jgi:diguanylate cyclase (GGDEF)-like protein
MSKQGQLADDDYIESTLEVTVSRDLKGIIELAAHQQAQLIVLSEPRLGSRIVLGESPVEIGRGSSCSLIIDSDSVSRRHARVEWTGSGHRVVDLGSTNGTFVNALRINNHELRDGDRIQFGKVLLKYVAGGNIEGNYHEELQRLMRFDPLTGVFNKRHFEEVLRVAIYATRTQVKSVGFMVFDLDHFKRINDTHGHVAGDSVLTELCSVVKANLHDDAVFGRVGGEEFAVLCEGASAQQMRQLGERLRQATEQHSFRFEGHKLAVTISVGVAERAIGADETPEQLYRRADEQLYAAKAAGRNRVKG